MTSDRSWVGRYRYDESKYLTEEYKNGVDSFLKFAIDRLKDEDEGLIRCPCQKCGNEYYKDPSDVRLDLYLHGIMQWYTRWDLHGDKEPRFETGTSSGNVGYNDDNICANPNELTSPNSGIVVIGTSYREMSNASSSHVERVNVRDPTNFFIDLTMFENDRSMAYHEEERNESDNEDQNEAIDIDEQSDNDDLT
ncbi:hypothetical protein POM88_007696 [Heracleum sosnowskyi]|uniref:Transposase-associated domain-containing protein n=1 Tax=Heracleum sosnowskyi TaxID=360622 RepID=A0AAD8N7V6_9APIA|nr:hypothetical protein POM88_007419 [Heracleum sosnowskyi]KAK1397833.1 hypothetical protein POM88_007696 [Heracleum sosnowskyi]